MIKRSEADLVLFVISAGIFPQSTVAFFLSIYSYVFKEKEMKVDCTGYIFIYIFTTDPLDLNIQINTKTTKIALYCRNGIGFHLDILCSESLSRGIFNLWLPHGVVLNDTFVEGVNISG